MDIEFSPGKEVALYSNHKHIAEFCLIVHNTHTHTHTVITQPDHVLTCTCVYEFLYFVAFQPTVTIQVVSYRMHFGYW